MQRGALSPLGLTLAFAISLFIIEVAVMRLLPAFADLSAPIRAIADALALTLLATPAMLLFFYRPMASQARRLHRTRTKLATADGALQAAVDTQTAALSRENAQLLNDIASLRRADTELYHLPGAGVAQRGDASFPDGEDPDESTVRNAGSDHGAVGPEASDTSSFTSALHSPLYLLVVVATSVFVAEAAVMMLFASFLDTSPQMEAFLDSLLLVLLISPVFYKFHYQPMSSHLYEVRLTQERLRSSHSELEVKVAARTSQLGRANAELRREIAWHEHYQEQLLLAASVFDNTIEGILITDINGVIERVNPSFTEITGYSAEEAIGQRPNVLRSDHHGLEFYAEMWRCLLEKGRWKGEVWNRRKDGEVYPEWLSITAIGAPLGETKHYLGVFHDITEVKHTQQTLSHQAHHDALTDLPNRLLVMDRLEAAVASARRHGRSLALLYLDLDDFKNVNDTLGHNIGDLYLKEVAQRLQQNSREEDTVARLGGDEFIIMLPIIRQPEEATYRARRLIRSFAEPICVENHRLPIGASIGITIYPDDGDSAEALIKNADIAMYRAKESGKNRYELYTEAMNVEILRRITLEHELRTALEQDELHLEYQPKIDLASGAISGVEALLRWTRPDATEVLPDDFIPIAESSGLIVPIGEWVFRSACEQAARWWKRGHRVPVAVNLSARQFADANLLEAVTHALEESRLPPEALEVEITESLLMQNRVAATELLWRLREMGIAIAIDDFGTGYSSLAYLKQLPIDTLKIDIAFIRDLPRDEDSATITSAVVSLATSLGLKTVAEGVEDGDQLRFLKQIACDQIQGHYFSPPVAPEVLTSYLEQGKRLDSG